ncbi:flagellar hook-length control protein FliK [Hydrocarboniphaga sp.]|uniref:flagellar hook-length control protein FliK n=1 Tax=Hydrocarboniphaga sp. TaxID=2033016 RepID=UPI003D0B38E3
MNLAADVSLPAVATPTRSTASAAANRIAAAHDAKQAANDGDRFGDCLKASSDAAADAEQASAEAAQPDKTTNQTKDERSADESESDNADSTQGLGLVASLLQTILAMPPKTDRSAPLDEAAPSASSGLPGIGGDVATTGRSAQADPLLLPHQPGGGGVDDALPTPATQTDVTALPAAHDTVADALLVLLHAPAAALTGTDRAAAVATPAPSQPVPHGELAEPLAERIVWMSDTARAHGGALQEARISLHPAELGSLQIKVELSHDGSTKVSFDVQTVQARQAIEASLPQLRELLAPNLVNAATASFQLSGGLSQQQQQASSQSQATRSGGSQRDGDATESQSVTPVATRRRVGLLDQFA